MRYAFLGTRQPQLLPPPVIDLYQSAAKSLAEQGGIILSGATAGADQLAAESALAVGGRAELFLPWALFERDWVQKMKRLHGERVQETVFVPDLHGTWLNAARATLPNGARLSTGSVAVHARYYGMLEGAEAAILMPYVRLGWQVVERPGDSRRRTIGGISGQVSVREQIIDKGSTEPAIQFAQRLEQMAFDLSDDEGRVRLLSLLRQPLFHRDERLTACPEELPCAS